MAYRPDHDAPARHPNARTFEHGTISRYRQGCRCIPCRDVEHARYLERSHREKRYRHTSDRPVSDVPRSFVPFTRWRCGRCMALNPPDETCPQCGATR